MGLLVFAGSSLITFVASSAVITFFVEHIEEFFTPLESVVVLSLLSAIATFLLTVGFGLGAAVFKRFPRGAVCAGLGCLASLLAVALLCLATQRHWAQVPVMLVLFALPFIGGAASLVERVNG